MGEAGGFLSRPHLNTLQRLGVDNIGKLDHVKDKVVIIPEESDDVNLLSLEMVEMGMYLNAARTM